MTSFATLARRNRALRRRYRRARRNALPPYVRLGNLAVAILRTEPSARAHAIGSGIADWHSRWLRDGAWSPQ
jgi:hypothetical protein